jgi:2-polyprenyl-3-methyl-5-hydroxy-6-metoxy-1,4-benzoquinol methylase
MPSSAELFQAQEVSERYLEHYGTLCGKVREQIVRRHIEQVVLESTLGPLRAIDVGCGDGRDAIWLAALGHEVIAVDPSGVMVGHARDLQRETHPISRSSSRSETHARCGRVERRRASTWCSRTA